jgi:hypothetical protein
MRRMTIGTTRTLIAGLLVMGLLALTGEWSQAQDPLQDVEKRLTEKRTAAETHRKQMEGIKEPDKLSTEMRRHFQMTEEVLALMLERRRLLEAQASLTPAGQGGGMQGGGMQGGMMQKEMGGMQGSGTQGSGTQGGGMQGMGMAGQHAPSPQGGPATPSSDMAQMMQRITEHSAYMETLKDQATLTQEMFRHQKMLDEMLQLMQ